MKKLIRILSTSHVQHLAKRKLLRFYLSKQPSNQQKRRGKNLKIVKWMKVVSFVRRKNRANLIKIFHRTGKNIRANGAQRSWLAFDVQKVVKLVK